MFNKTKSLIVVYKDEMLVNQLKKLVETKDDISEELSNRNNSILAHGLKHCSCEDAQSLLDKLKIYSCKTFDCFDENLEDSKFPKFKNIDL